MLDTIMKSVYADEDEEIIQINGLRKSFGDIKAVDGLSFRVKRGELFAFLGVNGAGKSTTISMICGQLRRDAGGISVCGFDIDRSPETIKRKIGVVFQNSVLDKALTVRDNLISRAELYGITGKQLSHRLAVVSALLDMGEIMSRPVGKLSGGQRRRADIARALIHDPEILILDEPTTGLDPQTRKMLWDAVRSLRDSEGLTVFLTTHYMEEAADADYAVIIDSGRIAAEGTPLDLKNRYTADSITLYGVGESEVSGLGCPVTVLRDAVRLSVPDTKTATGLIISHPELFSDYEIIKGRMDDVFLAVTGKTLNGGND